MSQRMHMCSMITIDTRGKHDLLAGVVGEIHDSCQFLRFAVEGSEVLCTALDPLSGGSIPRQ